LGLASVTTEEFDPSEAVSELIEGIAEGVVFTRGGIVAWASPHAAQLLGGRSPEALHGLRFGELLVDLGEGFPEAPNEPAAGGAAWVAPRLVCGVRGGGSGGSEEGRNEDADAAPSRVALRRASRNHAANGYELWFVHEDDCEGADPQELLSLRRKLGEANRELMRLREREAHAASEREELLDVVSHELRTPVTVIAGYNKLLLTGQMGELNPEQQRCLSESTKSCKRLNSFISSLLDASREGTLEAKLERVSRSLAPTIESVISFLRPLLEASPQTVHFEAAAEPAGSEGDGADIAHFDPIRIGQVITNLLGNAIKYGRSGGHIRIYTRRFEAAGQAFVEVSVEDQGPGVASWDRTRIFEPYVRGAGEVEAGGLGLGLAICKRIVEAHGGSIAVTDAQGGGSRFFFALPVAVHGREHS